MRRTRIAALACATLLSALTSLPAQPRSARARITQLSRGEVALADTTPSREGASTAAALAAVMDELAALRMEVAALRARQGELDSALRVARAQSVAVAAPAVVSPPRASVPAAAPPAPATTKGVARSIESGFGSIRIGGLLQAWYTNGTLVADNTFRIRRAELNLTGKVTPSVKWLLRIDAAKSLALRQSTSTVGGQRVVTDESVNQSSRMLQDAYVTVALPRDFSIDVGQFKVPFAYEGPNATSKVVTVERPMFAADRARGGGFSDARDIGVTLRGTLPLRTALAVGLFDGVGEVMNAADANDNKIVVANLATPLGVLPGLTLGVSGVHSATPNAEHPRRDRLAALAEYAHDRLTTRAEYARAVDGDLHRRGYYALLAYRVNSRWEFVQRYDYLDPEVRRATSATDEGATEFLTGFNLYLADHNAKLQVNAVRRGWQHDRLPTSRHLLVNLQTAW